MTNRTRLPPAPAGPLTGRVRVPGDKSISHRALIFGALTVGETRIPGLLEGEDVLNTGQGHARARRQVERTGEGAWRVHGVGVGGFAQPPAARFRQFRHRLPAGDGGGRRLPDHRDLRRRCLAAHTADAARARSAGADGRARSALPGKAAGCRSRCKARAIRCRSSTSRRCASAQLKSAVLLAGLSAPGETMVIEQEATRDHTERMLQHFGAQVAVEQQGAHGRRITLTGQPELVPAPVVVPADPSSAAFPMVAALIVPGSDIVISRA